MTSSSKRFKPPPPISIPSVAGLKALKAAKVSNDVIRAMVHQHPAMAGGGETVPIETAPAEAAPPETAPAASLSPPPFDKRGLPKEVGVYVILQGRLAEVGSRAG